MEFCYHSWNLPVLPPELDQICMSFAAIKKSSIDVESPMFSTKCSECKFEMRDGHGKLRSGMEMSWKSQGEKDFISVGSLR